MTKPLKRKTKRAPKLDVEALFNRLQQEFTKRVKKHEQETKRLNKELDSLHTDMKLLKETQQQLLEKELVKAINRYVR